MTVRIPLASRISLLVSLAGGIALFVSYYLIGNIWFLGSGLVLLAIGAALGAVPIWRTARAEGNSRMRSTIRTMGGMARWFLWFLP
jgi:hypothetical protein